MSLFPGNDGQWFGKAFFVLPLVGLTTLLSVETALPVQADVKLPAIFGDHMVLQQEAKVPVWGTADAGEKVTVTVGDHTASTTAGADGKWRVDLNPFPNGAPATTMAVTGKNTVAFQDVVVGDVWVASGQSNMWYTLEMANSQKAIAAQAEAIPSDPYYKDPNLRMFLVAQKTSLQPLTDLTSPFFWKVWTGVNIPESDGDHPGTWLVFAPHPGGVFSAVAYFFGKELSTHLNRPIGLIGSYWPGSQAEAWTSISGLQKDPPFKTYVDAYQQNLVAFPKLDPDYQKAHAAYMVDLKTFETKSMAIQDPYAKSIFAWWDACKKAKAAGQPDPPKPPDPVMPPKPTEPASSDGGPSQPGNLFNAMIAPLIPYAIKGVIWYQGESNAGAKAAEYNILFPRLITDWREKWNEGDFPFLYVQISHDAYANDGSVPLVREAQLKTLSLPKTGMAVTIDIPPDDPIHEGDKLDPAKRLALAARHVAYGEDVVSSGPLYQSMKVEGNAIRISFTNVGGGLIIGQTPYQPLKWAGGSLTPYPTDKLVGFTIAGNDKKFVPADAKIDGDTVVVSSPATPNPTAVRFAWADVPQDNLYNKENLPASPFRTDAWNDFKFAPPPSGVPPSFGLEALTSH